MDFKRDFIDILYIYGRLPIGSVKQGLKLLKDYSIINKKNTELNKNIAVGKYEEMGRLTEQLKESTDENKDLRK